MHQTSPAAIVLTPVTKYQYRVLLIVLVSSPQCVCVCVGICHNADSTRYIMINWACCHYTCSIFTLRSRAHDWFLIKFNESCSNIFGAATLACPYIYIGVTFHAQCIGLSIKFYAPSIVNYAEILTSEWFWLCATNFSLPPVQSTGRNICHRINHIYTLPLLPPPKPTRKEHWLMSFLS